MPLIDAQAVSKQFLLRHNAAAELKVRFLGLFTGRHRETVEEFWALKNVSLQIDRGEVIGLIGRNGSGKSTLLKLVAAIYRPTSGRLLVARGARISSMIELGVGFHWELTGRENVFLNAAIHGLTRQETEAIYPAIVEYSGLEHFIDVPIKNFSSGMYMRLGFAIAANLDPEILLLDEIFAVGDADFQQRCVGTLKTFMQQGRTIIFVSHGAEAVQAICRRACVLEQGELVYDGDVQNGFVFYDRLLARRSAHADSGQSSTPVTRPIVEGGITTHVASGVAPDAPTRAADAWWFEFMRHEGLEPHHHVLHLANRGTPAKDWSTFLGADRYVRAEGCDVLYQMREHNQRFDFAIAESIIPHAPFNVAARCIATVVRRLRPSGRLYASWYENPDAANLEPVVQPNGVKTYSDRDPYHYPFGFIANVCEAMGATVARASASHHPEGESMLLISRKE